MFTELLLGQFTLLDQF